MVWHGSASQENKYMWGGQHRWHTKRLCTACWVIKCSGRRMKKRGSEHNHLDGEFTLVWLSLSVIYKLKCALVDSCCGNFFCFVVTVAFEFFSGFSVVILRPVICYTIMFVASYISTLVLQFIGLQTYAFETYASTNRARFSLLPENAR